LFSVDSPFNTLSKKLSTKQDLPQIYHCGHQACHPQAPHINLLQPCLLEVPEELEAVVQEVEETV
jgi:hypothetical protein